VVGVAVVAAVASYEHAYDLVRMRGESGWTARLVPLTVDGLVYASSMVMLDSAPRKTSGPRVGAVAPRPVYRGDTRGQRRPWSRARSDRCGCGSLASGGLAREFAPHHMSETLRALAEARPDTPPAGPEDDAEAKIAECDQKPAQYRAELDAGADPATVAAWIAETEAEKEPTHS
jgi:Protein of unknown function (DUF2637)